jgi:predicted small lipoprotein YifL
MRPSIRIIILFLLLSLAACGSDAGPTDAPAPVTGAPAESAEPTPAPETGDASTNEVQSSGDSGSIDVRVTGAVEAAISYVTYNKNTDTAGVYDIRFFVDDSETDSPIRNDIIFMLPNELEPGTYTLESSSSPMINFNELDSSRALVILNLAPPNGTPFALGLGSPTTGELVITDTSNGALTGTFSLTIGEGDD